MNKRKEMAERLSQKILKNKEEAPKMKPENPKKAASERRRRFLLNDGKNFLAELASARGRV